MRRFVERRRTAGLVMMLAAGLAAQQPRMQNAKLETRAGSEAAVRQAIAAQTSPGYAASIPQPLMAARIHQPAIQSLQMG
ncbi:MAG: hypothetical protein K2X35_13120 [Bryobacteraceae bacterium]|nr:hypothetical protein [Bryobacteraceae bacterium]